MTTHSNAAAGTRRRLHWVGIGKFLFVAVLAVLFFLLAQEMVRDRFFEGGRYDRNGTIRQ